MDVRVLGPLEVFGEAGPVALGGLRQRSVLAVLIIEAGRVVSSDQLAELVWDGSPPDQAPVSLQAYVSKLRRALEPGRNGRSRPWEMLLTRAPGYVLALDPRSVDAARFERACDDAAERLREGQPARALEGLDAALGQWRGEPFADFAFAGFARSEIGRLTELRWRAVEDRAEARLRLGQHREVAGELDSVVRQAPLRERLRGQLIVALYRSGRQADALACFGAGRQVLVEELGLDPGPDLRRLEQAILDQDAGLDWTPPTESVTVRSPEAAAVVAPADVAEPWPAPPTGAVNGKSEAPSRLGSVRAPMIGRRHELDRVTAAVAGAAEGSGALVLVCGEAGIGKTRLAEEVAERAGADGLGVVWGRCPELEGVPPFWPWIQVLRTVLTDRSAGPAATVSDPFVATLVPELAAPTAARTEILTADSDAARFRLYDAVSQLLAAQSDRRPLLLLLEDLHWADAASLRLLRFLAPELRGRRLAVVATMRDHEGPGALDELRADAARLSVATRVDLRHLDRDGVGELSAQLAREPVPAALVDALAARSGGNPFFLGELIRLGQAGRGGVPAGVRDVIQRRVAQLDDATREVLTAASCFPGDWPLEPVAAILRRPPIDVLDHLDTALAARLVTESPDRTGSFRFSHPLVREALYEQLSGVRRAHLHGEIGRQLADRLRAAGRNGGDARPDGVGDAGADRVDDESAAQLAHHFLAAAPSGTVAEAVEWSLVAGHRALRRWAADEALARFEPALDLARADGGTGDAELADLLTGAGRARRFLGDGGGRALLDEAMRLSRAADEPARAVRAALATGLDAWGLGYEFGRVDGELRACLDWALPRLDPARPRERELRVLGSTCLAAEVVFADDPDLAPAIAADALAEARALGRPEPLAAALTARWITIWGPHSVTERRALLDELAVVCDAHRLDPVRLLLLRSADALEQADPVALDAVLSRTDELGARGRHPALEVMAAWRLSLRAILDGRFADGERLIGEAHALSERANPRDAFDATGGQLALLFWQWGRLGELAPLLQVAVDEQPHLRDAFGVVHALALAQAGEPERARAVIDGLDLTGRSVAPPVLARSGTVAALVALARELDDAELARTGLRFLGPDDGRSPAIIDHVGVFYCGARAGFRGLAHLVLGDLDRAVAALDAAVVVNERIGAVVYALRNRLDLVDALIRRGAPGDRERAAELAGIATEAATRLGLATGGLQST